MCTVTYIPVKDKKVFTSNRDENISRGITLSPKVYNHNNIEITYPKDEKGTGTWIAKNEHNTIAILLNGAFIKHQHNPPYKHSRGLLIPYFLQNKNTLEVVKTFDFKGIEPFTLILFFENDLYEFRWNEHNLFTKQLDITKAYLWNSVTLYTNEIERKNKEQLINIFYDDLKTEDIINFHFSKKYETQLPIDSEKNSIKTISLSQIIVEKKSTAFFYYDLLNNEH